LADLTEAAYAYTGGDPVNLVDPSGRCTQAVSTLDPGSSGCAGIWQKLLTRAFADKRGTPGNLGPHGAFTRYVELLSLGSDPAHVREYYSSRRALQKTLAEFQQQKCKPPDGQNDLFRNMQRIAQLPAPTEAQVKAYQRARAHAGGGIPTFNVSGPIPSVAFSSSPTTVVVLP
jgi:hypothetical protein